MIDGPKIVVSSKYYENDVHKSEVLYLYFLAVCIRFALMGFYRIGNRTAPGARRAWPETRK